MTPIQPSSPKRKDVVDVVIVGSRCSGSSLAIHLAREGHRVLLLDKGAFPSDTLSTHVTFNNTTELLEELGVLTEMRELGAPPVRRMRFSINDGVIEGDIPLFAGHEENYCIRRVHFDRVLLEMAASFPGVDIREAFEVEEILRDTNGDVYGVTGRGAGGIRETFRARLVVGADGLNSVVRAQARGARLFSEASRVSAFYAYGEGLGGLEPMFRMQRRGRFRGGLFPTTDGLHVLQVFVPHDEEAWISSLMTQPETALKRLFCWLAPELASYVLPARFEGPVRALMRFPNVKNQGFGPGWALVGDALCFKDPAIGQGIHDAFESSRLLAQILARFPDWRGSESEIRREYEMKFYNKIASRFESALSVSRAEDPTPAQADRFMRIASDPEATKRYLGYLNYRYSAEDLEETLQSGSSAAPMRGRQFFGLYGMDRGLCSPSRTY